MEPFSLELVACLPGHHDRVWSIAWSPRGDMLASCSADKTVRIWTRRPNTAAAADPTAGAVTAAAPIGAAATCQQTSSYSATDHLGGGTGPSSAAAPQQQQWYCSAILDQCHTRTIRSVAWCPTGRSLATASFDATVAVWELSGGVWEQVAELEGHENEVKCVAWNPDGRLIATCGRDRSVWIWESMPGREFECVDVKQGHSQDVKVVRWHPGGELLASAGYDDTIRLWTYDGDEWGCCQTLGGSGHGPGHSSTVWEVCWEPGAGRRLASCSDDLTVRIWESRGRGAAAPAGGCGSAAGPAGAGGTGAGAAAGAGGGLSPSRPDLRCAAVLSGYHCRTVFSVDWGPHGVIATGDGDDSIMLFGQGDPDLARLLVLREGGEAGAGGEEEAGMQGLQQLGHQGGEEGHAETRVGGSPGGSPEGCQGAGAVSAQEQEQGDASMDDGGEAGSSGASGGGG
ncbi:hypothetical protein Agub_g12234, partial [Astrephomene gubernaculifera]